MTKNENSDHLVFGFDDTKGWKPETTEQMVLRIVTHDFESQFGISYKDFDKLYKDMLEHQPEKLI